MLERACSVFIAVGIAAGVTSIGHAMHGGGINHHGPAHPNEEYGVKKIAENVYAYVGQDGGSNSGFIVASEGIIVIDAQYNSELAAKELAAIRKISSAPIKFLVDTHHHGDHTGGNPTYEKEGVTIISHRECRAVMVERQKQGLPVLTFDGAIQLYVEGREVHVYHYGWGHSVGDAVIVLPDADIVFAGDVLFSEKFPYVWDGNFSGWISSLEKLKSLNSRTIVPGHGPVSTNREVDELLAFFQETMTAVAALKGEGKSVEECKQRVDFTRYIEAGWGGESNLPAIVEWLYMSQ